MIVGSGPSAAAAALALAAAPDVEVTVLDLGLELESARAGARDRIAITPLDRWAPDDVRVVTEQPVATAHAGLPEKRIYGSDYPFRDAGQLSGLLAGDGVNPALISGAYGGFSTVWGAQLLPFPIDTFRSWPIRADDMAPHYKAVLEALPFSATAYDLAEQLPLYSQPNGVLPLSPRAASIIRRYTERRSALRPRVTSYGKTRKPAIQRTVASSDALRSASSIS